MIAIDLLGGLCVRGEGISLTGRAAQKKRLAILPPLVISRERGMSRDKLIALLWPETDAARARHQLASSLYELRRTLGDDAIISATDAVSLNTDLVCSDVWTFADAIARGDLELAVAQYRGPFLDGFYLSGSAEFDRWVEGERAALARTCAGALRTLAEAREGAGDWPAAAARWRQLTALEPYSGTAALRLMRALVTAGDSAGAVQTAEAHAALLRSDLDVAADAAITELVEELREATHATRISPDRTRARSVTPLAEAQPSLAGAPSTQRGVLRRRRGSLALGVALILLATMGLWRQRAGIAPARRDEVDARAHDLYLRGQYAWGLRSKDGLESAVLYFREAIEREPTYAAAYAGLANAYVLLGYLGYYPNADMFPKGKAAALKAIELGGARGDAYAALGMELTWERRWSEAEVAFRRAIELSPSYATAHHWYALELMTLGRMDDARREARIASELDPLSLQINNTYGIVLYFAGDTAAAVRQFERTVAAEPDSQWVRRNPWLLANMGRVLAAAGRTEQALRLVEQALTLVPRHPRALGDLAEIYVLRGDRRRALLIFARADSTSEQYPLWRAKLFASMGEPDSVFASLARMREWSPSTMSDLRGPNFVRLRDDARYSRLLGQLGLP